LSYAGLSYAGLSCAGVCDGALRSCGDGAKEEDDDVGYGATEYGMAE